MKTFIEELNRQINIAQFDDRITNEENIIFKEIIMSTACEILEKDKKSHD